MSAQEDTEDVSGQLVAILTQAHSHEQTQVETGGNDEDSVWMGTPGAGEGSTNQHHITPSTATNGTGNIQCYTPLKWEGRQLPTHKT